MKLSIVSTSILGMLALSLGCANHKSRAPQAPVDYAYDGMAEQARVDDAMASGAPAGPPASLAQPKMPATAQLGTLPPQSAPQAAWNSSAPKGSTAQGSSPETAIADDLPTTGSDSAEQMLIFNGSLGLMVDATKTNENIDAAVDLAVRAGGYIAQQNDTMVIVRVPSGRFRRVMRQIEELGDITSRSVQTLDVSEEFHDIEVRLENLEATRTRIQKLLAQAKDLPQILTVEKELERVSAQIDQLQGRLRFLSSQAAFSTITVAFAERPVQQAILVDSDHVDNPPPPPPPPHVLDTSVEWIDSVGVHRLMNLD